MFPKLVPLVQYLNSLNGRADLKTLEQILGEHEIGEEDVQSACFFNHEHYQRNKISCSKWYDLLVLCWLPGQRSAIHDHAGSSCAFKIVKGNSTEVRYNIVPGDPNGNLVKPAGKRVYREGEICSAEDGEIHHIANESASDNLITLHMYSPPLHMNYYVTEPGTKPSLHTPNLSAERILSGEQMPGERPMVR